MTAPTTAPTAAPTVAHFTDLHRTLHLFAEGVAGQPMEVLAFEPGHGPARTDGTVIHVPAQIDAFDSFDHNRRAYLVVLLQQIGHLQHGTFRFDPSLVPTSTEDIVRERPTDVHEFLARGTPGASPLEQFIRSSARPVLMRTVFGLLEAFRVEAANRRYYPGAIAAFDRARAFALGQRAGRATVRPADALLESLVQFSLGADRAVLAVTLPHPSQARMLDLTAALTVVGATVHLTAAAARSICALIIDSAPGSPAQLDTVQAEDLDAAPDPEAPTTSEQVTTGADDPTAELAEPGDPTGGPAAEFHGELQPDAVYRRQQQAGGTNGSLTDAGAETVAGEADPGQSASGADEGTPSRSARIHPSSGPRQHLYLYDEWDYRNNGYLRAWCHLHETRIDGRNHQFIHDVRRDHAAIRSRIRRRFAAVRPEARIRVHHTDDGDELSLEALIEAVVDRRTGHRSDEHLYIRRDRARRDVAVAFLLDLSGSTDSPVVPPPPPPEPSPEAEITDWFRGGYYDIEDVEPPPVGRRVIDVAKDAVAVMCDAMHLLGDSHAVYGFSGRGREHAEFLVAKDFDDHPSARTWAALGAMEPMRYTRMGPAIRHATSKLAAQPQRTRVLLLISDGYPQDEDYGPDRGDHDYGIHDTARALQEAEATGITTFCVTVDPAGHDYLRRMCPEQRYLVIDDIEALTGELDKVYAALTLRR